MYFTLHGYDVISNFYLLGKYLRLWTVILRLVQLLQIILAFKFILDTRLRGPIFKVLF
jgi:hypothetical protein